MTPVNKRILQDMIINPISALAWIQVYLEVRSKVQREVWLGVRKSVAEEVKKRK